MKINWSSLTKEQKQITLLIGMGVLFVLASIYEFVLQPLMTSAVKLKEDIARVHERNAKATMALGQEGRLQADVLALKAQLTGMTNTLVPPFGNVLTWVTEQIYLTAKDVGVEIEGLAGTSQAWGAEAGSRSFAPFAAQMNLQCSYEDLLRFLRALETKNPLVTVTTMSIEGREQNAGHHRIGLSVEWPNWGQLPMLPSMGGATNSATHN